MRGGCSRRLPDSLSQEGASLTVESMEALLLGIAVGFFSGIIPGAFSTVVATTVLERGMAQG